MTAADECARIARFVAVGALNTLVGLVTIYLCKLLLGTGDAVSNVIGYAVGLTNSFAWNRRWTFAHSGRVVPAAARFTLVFLISYSLNLVAVMAAIHLFAVNSYFAHAIGIAPYTVAFYIGSRWFAFGGGPCGTRLSAYRQFDARCRNIGQTDERLRDAR